MDISPSGVFFLNSEIVRSVDCHTIKLRITDLDVVFNEGLSHPVFHLSPL